jgi:predicted nucleic-acid-binding protein
MRAIDTDVPVRLITRDDFRQAPSAESFIEKGAWVPVLALAEAAWVLATVYELSSDDLIRAIEMLLEHRDLVLQDAETVACALEL